MPCERLFGGGDPVVPYRGFHLDLKGTPPTPSRLMRLLEVFAAARYNAVLVEWEDAFPWTVDTRFRSETAYTPEVVGDFMSKALELGMEVIPLVQCLGHVETALNLTAYEHLREVPHQEGVLNPLAPGARELIQAMVDDVIALNPGIRYFHLGGDEAWTFGTHPDTSAYIEQHGKGALYLHHIDPILESLNARGIRPILWHDMMREWDSASLRRLAGKADLLTWGYRGHPDTTPGHWNSRIIERFVEHGVSLWGGTAYKGADGATADLPNLAVRQENAQGWTDIARRYGYVGVVATAWSRYSTNIQQCEPIDGSLDSAFNVGVILHDGKPPAGGIEACVEALGELRERDNFESTRDALAQLARSRDAAWSALRRLRELLATVTMDPRRRPCWNLVSAFRDFERHVRAAEAAGSDLAAALHGLMGELWIHRYIGERVTPLLEELATLEPRVQMTNPAAYRATRVG